MDTDDFIILLQRFDALDSRLRRLEIRFGTVLGLVLGLCGFNVAQLFFF